MPRIILLAQLCVMTSIYAINRPVYKIVLTQKGYAQFLQYDVETPPLREFTFCTWIRVYDLSNEQTIFTYIVNGNNRIMRLWLDSGGKTMQLSIKETVTSNFTVSIVKDVWRHVCLSYQSDYGAWALYLDSRLVSCEAAQTLYGYVLPGGGSVVVGYGSDNDGNSNGFEGEIFGANMILTSTVEKNYTNRKDPLFEQKLFSKNKVRNMSEKNMQYIILSDLQTEGYKNNFDAQRFENGTRDYSLPFQTQNNFVEHAVGFDIETTTNRESNEEDLMEDSLYMNYPRTDSVQFDLWKTLNSTFFPPAETTQSILADYPRSSTHSLPLYETPPPNTTKSYYDTTSLGQKAPKMESIYKLRDSTPWTKPTSPRYSNEIFDIETPPPIYQNSKVYGQWTSSKFAGNVLNYLKSINFQKRDPIKKVPPTISLNKYSDAYPYASDFAINKLRPPPQFVRTNFLQKRFDVLKRDKQVNVQILGDDIRSNIIKMHSLTQPKNVDITNRGGIGEAKKSKDRFYRSIIYEVPEKQDNSIEQMYQQHPFPTIPKKKFRDFSVSNIPNQKFKSVLPFLKSLDNPNDETQTSTEPKINTEDMYTKTLSQGNKWHNVKSYSNDYTPRKIDLNSIETNVDSIASRHPAIRLKYKHEERKFVEDEDPSIIKGRKLAMEVSNQANFNKDSVSILKYNHGYLDKRAKKHTRKNTYNSVTNSNNDDKRNFNKQVKLGNALNEQYVVSDDEEQTKKSLFREKSNITRYKIELENEYGAASRSVQRVCKNVELYDRVLYVQEDESIDMTHILSPVRAKNIGIEFIIQNYKKCSLTDSKLQMNPKLYINWSKTPVRLFGGATPKTTTDLCGFF